MMFLFVVVLVALYAVAASWAAGYGPSRHWMTAAAALLLIAAGGVLLGRHYAVPSLLRLLVYAVALTGPIVVVPTRMLSFATPMSSALAKTLPMAVVGACLGLICGIVIVVYGLGVW